ncbi:hypothetical protein FOHLNKBM_6281 [Methylobacterium longum]|nr:hypothetical protein FOHLNKBM_6281 [Methylobacterium longum]
MRSVKLLILLCLMAAGLIVYTDKQAVKGTSEPDV